MSVLHSTTWHIELNEDIHKNEEKQKAQTEIKEKDVVYKLSYKNVSNQCIKLNHNMIEYPPEGSSKFYVSKTVNEDKKKQDGNQRKKVEEIKTVKLATQDKLIQLLGSETGSIDTSFVSIYLSTYRSFISPQILVEKILRNYYNYSMKAKTEEPSRSNYLKSLTTVIYLWTSKYRLDFFEPPRHHVLRYLRSFFTSKCPCKKLAEPLSLMLREHEQSSYDYVTFRGFKWKSPPAFNDNYQLNQLSPWEFAEQLTCIEAELFCRVFPPQCLSSVWANRAKNPEKVKTVKDTVDQFNDLTYRVISCILAPERPQERAELIEHWIEIAKELRYLKNFSSLKALTSAFRSTSIFRLKKTWALVDQKHLSIMDKLTRTMSDDDNQIVLRDIMIEDLTSKFATVKKHRTIKRSDGHKDSDLKYLNLGIVPYLGTFLFDLTMINSSANDLVPVDGSEAMVNFEKKRKEHSVLAQLSMLQASCRLYNLNFHPEFYPLFMKIPFLTEHQSYNLSCLLEPTETTPKTNPSISQNISNNCATEDNYGRRSIKDSLGTYEKSFCNPSFVMDYALSDCWTFNSLQNKAAKKNNERKMSTISASVDTKLMDGRLMKECIAKVYIEGVAGAAYCSKYKSILVCKRDRTENIIFKTLNKYNVSCDVTAFHLFQILPNHTDILFEGNTRILKNILPCHTLEFLVKKKHHPHATYI